MQFPRDLPRLIRSGAAAIWRVTWAKELAIFVATAVAAVLVLELNVLLDLLENGAISFAALSTWAAGAVTAMFVTGFRQLVAWAIAHLAGARL